MSTLRRYRYSILLFLTSLLTYLVYHLNSITTIPLTTEPLQVLMPMSQSWAQEQFTKSLLLRNLTYGDHNDWRKCSDSTFYYDKIKTVFTGVPKAGHSNWREALSIANGDMKVNATFLEQQAFLQAHPVKRVAEAIKEFGLEEFGNVFSFTVIRNPWTRLVSGYINKMTPQDMAKSMRALRMNVVKEMRGIADEEELVNLFPTFPEFAQWIIRHRGFSDPHFKPQSQILCIPAVRYDMIVPLEYAVLLKDKVLNSIRGSQSKISERPGNFLRLSYDFEQDPRKQTSVLRAKEMLAQLDKATVEKLYEVYKADFALLNYSDFTDVNFPLPLQYN